MRDIGEAVARHWAHWNTDPSAPAWTVGVEEEVMLLDPEDWQLASRIDDVLTSAPAELAGHLAAETHGSAVEISTGPHADPADAVGELGGLRDALAATLEGLGLAAAAAGTHPFANWTDTEVAPGPRQQIVFDSMRELARREPTFALHVHVAVPDAEVAIRAMNRMRAHIPLLLALSANSPYWQGRDTGLASTRTPLFQAFPRVGIPRAFESYGDWVESVDTLIRCGAFPEPTFLWWDLRVQPRYGTLEIRVMDAQSRIADVAGLVSLVQALVRLESSDEGFVSSRLVHSPELLEENRFLALRDGMDAELLDPEQECRVPVRAILQIVLDACEPAARPAIEEISALPGYARQRWLARSSGGLPGLLERLQEAF